LPEYQNESAAITSRTTPGTAERCICLGDAGLPDKAVTMGTLVIARAGRDAAKNVAAVARAIAAPMTAHGSWNTPIT
jgi:hypothetical protein